MKRKNFFKREGLSFIMPLWLIPQLPILLLFSNYLQPIYALFIYGIEQIIVPIVAAILINLYCKRAALNRWLSLGCYLFSLCLSIGVGILWVYLLLKDAPHPIVFWTYLWISGASILFNSLVYVGLMLAFNRRKREPLNNQLFIKIYTPASNSILWESRVVINEGRYCLAHYHDDSKSYYDLIPLSDEASDYIKSVIAESGYSFDYEYKDP